MITILNGSNISWHDEVACATEDSRNVQERLDDVLDFIDKYGNVYNHRIKQALKKFDNLNLIGKICQSGFLLTQRRSINEVK